MTTHQIAELPEIETERLQYLFRLNMAREPKPVPLEQVELREMLGNELLQRTTHGGRATAAGS